MPKSAGIRTEAEDARRGPKTKPRNALSEQERAAVVEMMNAPEHSSMSPDTLVLYLATRACSVTSSCCTPTTAAR